MARSATKQDVPYAPLIPIRDVERQTGIAQATLRMWEKRYGFPLPSRDRNGDRVCTPQQVERLRLVRQLIDQGKRPGKILPDDSFLQSLSDAPQRKHAEALPAAHAAAILLLSQCCFAELRGRRRVPASRDAASPSSPRKCAAWRNARPLLPRRSRR